MLFFPITEPNAERAAQRSVGVSPEMWLVERDVNKFNKSFKKLGFLLGNII